MSDRTLHIGVVTDEVSRDLPEALQMSAGWGISRFELREGGKRRFPFFEPTEISAIETALASGAQVTAVSPGIFKSSSEDEAQVRHELENILPRSLEMAARFGAPLLIVFGFERYAGEPTKNRTRAMRAFEQAAEAAIEADVTIAIENEPNFWIDGPAEATALLDEIGHPALKLNWDPANMHWGGRCPTYTDFVAAKPHMVNLHVKDFYSKRPEAPWLPVGQGETPWGEILPWVFHETALPHITLETHCEPLRESSEQSLEELHRLIEHARQHPTT